MTASVRSFCGRPTTCFPVYLVLSSTMRSVSPGMLIVALWDCHLKRRHKKVKGSNQKKFQFVSVGLLSVPRGRGVCSGQGKRDLDLYFVMGKSQELNNLDGSLEVRFWRGEYSRNFFAGVAKI